MSDGVGSVSPRRAALRLLDGHGFAQAVHAGTLAVVRECATLNRINVFPVPDADTGTNLAATLRAASAQLGAVAPSRIGDAARLAAEAALEGARGNSGAIVAQFFHGLAESFAERPHVGTREFAAGAGLGSRAAWRALQDPREGTILSVLRVWSRELSVCGDHTEDLAEALTQALKAARRALAETPRQLAVLARHHVVDAGGQGFVYFLEGVSEWVRTGESRPPAAAPPAAAARLLSPAHPAIDSTYRYCAEALLSGVDLDPETVKARFASLGDSLVVAGGGARLRVHLHTNAPQRFMDEASRLGALEASKVDDMILQQLAGRRANIALVSDSTCDLPEALAHRLGVVRVPLTLTIDGHNYRDGVDMTAAEYYRRLPVAVKLPTSSQPPVGDFREIYERLLEHHDGIVSLHIAGALSGTVEAARSAAEAVGARRVRVIDTHKVSIGAGLLIEAAGQAIDDGASIDDVENLVRSERHKVALFGTVSSFDQAVKGGRVSQRAARLFELAHLHPIILFDDEGRAMRGGVALGFDAALHALVRRAVAFAAGQPARLMVVHTDKLDAAETVAEALCRKLGVSEIPVAWGGPVITTHVGLGCVTVAVRRLR
jgi:DegV family protein with EDD domain